MQAISVRFLGGFEVRHGNRQVASFEYEKLRALLAYLLLEPAPHSREMVSALFWPDEHPEAARHSLRQALLKLRSLFKDETLNNGLIVTSRTTIQRNPDMVVQSDVEEFEKCLKQISSSACRDPGKLEQTALLYRGELLQGLSYPDGVAFEEWFLSKREKYRRMAANLFDLLTAHFEKKGDYRTASCYAERLISVEPGREYAHRRLLLLLARTGRRTTALKKYQELQRRLQKSFAVAPEPETQRAYARIRDAASAQFHLPGEQTPFIGREPELSTLSRLLSDRSNKLITITGLGGMGKTRIAIRAGIRAANEQARSFLNGIYFIPLVGIFTLNHLQSAIAHSLGLPLSPDENTETQLLRFLHDKELLLILDNFENLINDANLAFLTKIIDSASSVQLLLTSRQKLNFRREQVFAIAGLPVPQSGNAVLSMEDHLENCSSVDLFLSGMKRIRPHARPGLKDMENIARICHLLEGMPLAIELASAWTDALPLSGIADRIRAGLDVLQRDSPDLPRRHRSIRAVFDGTWLRLSSEERRVMADASVFLAGFTREAFEAVTGESFILLDRLIALSLIQSDLQTERYHIHELLRQFCNEKLSRLHAARVRSRHCRFFSSFMQALQRDLICAGEDAVLKKTDSDYENISSAWQQAVEGKKLKRLGEMAAVLHHFYSRRGRFQEGLDAFSAALAAIRRYGPASEITIARLRAFQADLYRETGHIEAARTGFRQSLRILRKCDGKNSRPDNAFCHWKMGLLTPRAEEAGRWIEQGLEMYKAIGDKPRMAGVLVSYGLWWKSAGNLERSKACLQESLVILRNFNSHTVIAEASYHLAGLYLRQGQYDSSEALFLEGIDLSHRSGDFAKVAQGLFLLSQCHFCTGKFELMEKLLRECIELQERLGQKSQTALSLAFLGLGFLHLGRYALAEKTCNEALNAAMEENYPPALGIAKGGLACVRLAEGAYTNASDLAREGMQEYQTGWQEDWRARHAALQAFSAHAHSLLGQTSLARMELTEALKTAFDVRSLIALLSCLPVAAVLLLKEGHYRKAAEIYALSKTQPHVARSVWFSDVAETYIMRATAHFPADIQVGSLEQTDKIDLWTQTRSVLRNHWYHTSAK